MKNYVTFRKFTDPEMAAQLQEALIDHNIDAVVEEDSYDVDISFSNNSLIHKSYLVKINSHDFERADQILTEESEKILDGIPADYYLYAFDDTELTEIVENPDEWSKTDYLLAIRLLKERGKTVTEEYLEEKKKEKIRKLEEPVRSNRGIIISGYIFSLLGFFGFIIGFMLLQKTTLPDGRRVYIYTEKDRAHGKNMIGITITMMVLLMILAYLSVNGMLSMSMLFGNNWI